MKKLFTLLAAVLFLALTLAGCGNAGTGDDSETAPRRETIIFSGWETVDLGCCATNIPVRETALLGANSVTHAYNDFVMTINADSHTYSTADIINIWGTLEYVGDNDTIQIDHGCPFMYFTISGGDEIEFDLDVIVVAVLISSVLEQGRVYHFEFQKNGAWDADDPNAAFWESFFDEEDLILPAGEYTIALHGGFSVPGGSDSGLRAELTITVTP